jgi:hypothetical protein
MQLQHLALLNRPCSLAASVAVAVILFSIAFITMHINITALATAAIANRTHVCCSMKLYYVFAMNSKKLVIAVSSSSSSSIAMQCSVAACRAVARKGAYSSAPTLRSNATTSRWCLSMAHLRGVLPSLQAGGWVESMRIIQQ